MATPSISVHITLTIDPARVNDFLVALKPTFDAVKSDPLNTYFEVFQDPRTPGVFKLVENWNASPEYMMKVQTQKEVMKTYNRTIEPMVLKPHAVEVYSRMPNNQWVSVK
ncbi:hypothetical protein BJ166DRAFT_580519 [Pestalotiopsis sp. NC0098]|nr:hypothetical protein BJ166DRAFT_580519 [Pestalotiopsis sp. NC0098]KAI4591922.1 hypothetical protein KJ359_012108 [Pestalotiopsis sp. 9143b]